MFCNDSRYAPNERSFIYCFSYGLVNIFVVNLIISFVWQWFSRRAQRAFIHLLLLLRFGYLLRMNLWIPSVWQWFSQRAPLSFTHLLLFLVFGLDFLSNHMNSLCLAMILATRPTSVHSFIVCLKGLGNICVVNLCIPNVWQRCSRCAPLSFTYLVCSIWFG